MPLTFACAVSHAPGMTAWPDAADPQQRARLTDGFARLRRELAQSGTEILVLLTSEHWANFFLDHIGAFCIGRASEYTGPIEPWLHIERAAIKGDPQFAEQLLLACYDNGFELSFSYEMEFDHGTILPLHFLRPEMDRPIVPIMFNTLAVPQPTAKRCLELGRVLGRTIAQSNRRIGVIATGGMSHDPGERNHGVIDTAFDRAFLDEMTRGDQERLATYTREQFGAAGAGAFELLAWVALAGILDGRRGEVVAYEPVKPWATGIGLMGFA